jgi:hypothetical protein
MVESSTVRGQLARALREVKSEPADTDLPLGHRMVPIQDN